VNYGESVDHCNKIMHFLPLEQFGREFRWNQRDGHVRDLIPFTGDRFLSWAPPAGISPRTRGPYYQSNMSVGIYNIIEKIQMSPGDIPPSEKGRLFESNLAG
jgi:hypothetical protein